LEVKLPTIWTDGKAEVGRLIEEEKREDQRRERMTRQKMQVREKVGKLRSYAFFQLFVAPEGRKVGSLMRRVRGRPLLEVEMSKKRTPLWREAHFEVKSVKN
jgi:predicted RNA-binding protein